MLHCDGIYRTPDVESQRKFDLVEFTLVSNVRSFFPVTVFKHRA